MNQGSNYWIHFDFNNYENFSFAVTFMTTIIYWIIVKARKKISSSCSAFDSFMRSKVVALTQIKTKKRAYKDGQINITAVVAIGITALIG